MRLNLFTMQVLGLLVLLPTFVILEFTHKKINTGEKQAPVKIATIDKTITTGSYNGAAANVALPHGAIFLIIQ